MRTLVLIKQTATFQLSHLYEHLFVAHLNSYMREKGFFAPFDYSLDARTYASGVVIIEMRIYSDEIKHDVADKLVNLPITLESERLNIAIKQLEAEKGVKYTVSSEDELINQLQLIHDMGWQSADDISKIYIPNTFAAEAAIIPNKSQKSETKEVEISLSVDKDQKDLLPLFRVVGGLILEVLGEDLADTYGGFVSSEAFTMNDDNEMIKTLVIEHKITPEKVTDLYDEAVEDMKNHQLFDRLVNSFTSNNYMSVNGNLLPSVINTMEDTGYIVGSKGWKELCSTESINTILDGIKITIR